MFHLSRRTVVLSAAAAGAAFGLNRPLEIVPAAYAQQGGGPSPLNPKGMAFHKFKVGDIEVTTVFDGAIIRDHNPSFIKNATVDETKAALKAAGLPDAQMPNAYTITIVKIGERTIMFDSGNGEGSANTGLLQANMKAAGLDPTKLSAIVVTHFHPDHIFGLMTKDNGQVYGSTEIVVPEAEYKFWTDPAVISTLPEGRRGLAQRIQATLPNFKNIRQHSGGSEVVPGVRAIATHGHAPGHTSYILGSGGAQLIVTGDVTNLTALNLANPGWHISFDQDAQMAEATRRKLFDQIVADKAVATGYHWGMPGAGTIQKTGSGYALVAVGA